MADLTVVIPCFNGGAYVSDAIESVLGQTGDIEVVVVDDGSTDESAAIASSFGEPVQVVRHPENRGLEAALATGVRASRAELVMVLADDDVLLPGSVPALVDAAATYADVSVFIPEVEAIDYETGASMYQVTLAAPILDLHRVLALEIPQTCGVVFRKDVLLAHPYRPVRDGNWVAANCEDLQQWLELAVAGERAMVVPGARAQYRNRPGSISDDVGKKWRAGNALLRDPGLRHAGCRDCERAAARGRSVLRDYCFNKDLVQIFGDGGGGLPRALATVRRDPVLTPRLAYAAGWRLRDRLVGFGRGSRSRLVRDQRRASSR